MVTLYKNCIKRVFSKDCFKSRIIFSLSSRFFFLVQMSCLGILVLQLINYLFYKGPPEHHIQMTIDFMDISDNGYDACYHWLEVRYNLMGQDGPE